jgi:hypothetical protein
MMRHRFRTATIVGKWWPTREQACEDALRAGQARRDPDSPDGLRWTVPGEIETDGGFGGGRR